MPSETVSFETLLDRDPLCLYAGDVPEAREYGKFVGLSLWHHDARHIKHDITVPMPLPDGCVDVYQAEDVFEHIDIASLPGVVSEIHRVLKPGGVFRLAVPDYRCDVLAGRSVRDGNGRIVFDPGGGGRFEDGKVVGGGHLWFPTYESVNDLLRNSPFRDIRFLHYYDEAARSVLREIDYSIGHVSRTPDNDDRVKSPRRPMSIVVDLVKD